MKEVVEHAAETAAIKLGQAATAGGGSVSFYLWVFSDKGVAFIGILAALGGLWVTWHYARKRDAREAKKLEFEMRLRSEEHTATMQEHERTTKGVE